MTMLAGFVVTYRRVVGERMRERRVSIECAHCGRTIAYSGTGRRPRYCSPTCRSRAWELRRAAARLAHANPMPKVVREVVERTVERDRPVSVPAAPTTIADWLPLLDQLTRQVRETPRALVRGPDDWQELARAVRQLHDSFAWRDDPAPANTADAAVPTAGDASVPARLSRQQRRALDRQHRKQQRH